MGNEKQRRDLVPDDPKTRQLAARVLAAMIAGKRGKQAEHEEAGRGGL